MTSLSGVFYKLACRKSIHVHASDMGGGAKWVELRVAIVTVPNRVSSTNMALLNCFSVRLRDQLKFPTPEAFIQHLLDNVRLICLQHLTLTDLSSFPPLSHPVLTRA